MSGLTGNNILAGSSGQGGYEIEQSLRLEDGDNAYLSRTNGTPTNDKINTLSFWLKRGNITTSGAQWFFSGGLSGWRDLCGFNASSDHFQVSSSSTGYGQTTDMVFRDVGAWYHIVVVYDTTEALNDNRIKIYVNGSQVTTTKQGTVPLNQALGISVSGDTVNVGRYTSATPTSGYGDGYLAECHFIDGQALDASYFGETDPLTNKWIPKKYLGTYGNIGWYLNFSDSASLGADSSGNGGNFTNTNLAATDQVLDSPTNNFCTWNPLMKGGRTALSEGNLKVNNTSAVANNYNGTIGTQLITSGKWYWEHVFTDDRNGMMIGVFRAPSNNFNNWLVDGDGGVIWNGDGAFLFSTNSTVYYDSNSYSPVSITDNDVLQIAFDADNGDLYMGVNGTWANSGSPVMTGIGLHGASGWVPGVRCNAETGTFYSYVNFGQDSSFAGIKTAQNNTDGNGKGDFHYSPLSGYLALCEDNLPDPSVALPGEHFNTALYVSNNSTLSVTGVGFQPDFTWHKNRTNSNRHALFDSVRGVTNRLASNLTDAEVADGDTLTSFDSDGFSIGADAGQFGVNFTAGSNFVTWCWKANNTSGSTNTDGTITSTVSANPTAGFSIVSYAGNSTNGATVGHGLSQEPELIIYKDRDDLFNWYVHSTKLSGKDYVLTLNSLDGQSNPGGFAGFTWNSSVITFPSTGYYGAFNLSGDNYIAYCFHSVEGYSKFGSYTGNGGNNGPFIYTGFSPAFLIVKETNTNVQNWYMMDNKRGTNNPVNQYLYPNQPSAENGYAQGDVFDIVDFVSNGFKIKHSRPALNQSGNTLIYMAFAESPFKYSNAR